ncbi:MAG: hypothetical protein ACPL1B_04775 [Thermoprotei archaeon]
MKTSSFTADQNFFITGLYFNVYDNNKHHSTIQRRKKYLTHLNEPIKKIIALPSITNSYVEQPPT